MNSVPKNQRKRLNFDSDSVPPCKLSKTTTDLGQENGSLDVEYSKQEKKAESCSNSISSIGTCFACKIDGCDLTNCSRDSCDRLYHESCLRKLSILKSDRNACPQHFCSVCYSRNLKGLIPGKGEMLKCFHCPTAFHRKEDCHVPGSVLLTQDLMSCPEHLMPEKHRGYPSVMNLSFCVICGCNENLVYCKFCPESNHTACSQLEVCEEKYVCSKCKSKNILSYGDIIWAKVYNFRWWPAKILKPSDLPPEPRKMVHFDGEFPIKLFGMDDYYWIQKQRAYPFVYKTVGREDYNVQHNFKKILPNPMFEKAIELAFKEMSEKDTVKRCELSSHKKLPYYKHIKSNRPVGTVQIFSMLNDSDHSVCGCKADDPSPCGYNTLCLNRNMCIECKSGLCEAGDLCQNQKFQKLEYASVKPFLTENRGWGLKCMEDILNGHFVIEYCGDLINEDECERRIKEKQAIGDTNFYFCMLDSNRIIDAGPKGNFSRFINHSCEPNCETQKWIINGDPRVGVFAIKDIPANSELTFDYQMDFAHNKNLKCSCGSKRCKGLIGKKLQGVELDMREKNGGYFTSSDLPNQINTNLEMPSKTFGQTMKKKNNKDSKKGKNVCFSCKIGGKLLNCSIKSCSRLFHYRCAKENISSKECTNWICPSHFCIKCKHESVFQCIECPNSFCKVHATNNFSTKMSLCMKH